ncbi:MAG: aspartate aminotransferase family protein [Legionellales bacterium]|nr:aspartate aminotransferase family protein [Legionellales bacterium]|tara:strand:+ start:23 stop:1189 length:1167 start_codon:yes stop_codon:yes gene_type:complete
MSEFLMKNYNPLPVSFVKGEGSWLVDDRGERYLDALGGIAVCALGHSHPSLSEVISEQSASLMHTSNIYRIASQEELAKKLVIHSGMSNVFFCNSGAEANEAAIKLARLYASKRKISNPHIVVMENSFHGRTMATLSATGSKRVHQGFAPLVPGFKHIPYNNIEVLKSTVDAEKNIVAVMIEPIQGEGGIIVPDKDYLKKIRSICDENNLLMIVDEVQTGMCRTGKWFAFQHENILPDIITIAKALGNGVPIGACLARGESSKLFQPGSHGSTFGGGPFVSSIALKVIDILEKHKMDEYAAKLGSYLIDKFKKSLEGTQGIVDIRGKGLMIGIELEKDCPNLVEKALENKLLINVTSGKVIRLLPPLIMNEKEADQVVSILTSILKKY